MLEKTNNPRKQQKTPFVEANESEVSDSQMQKKVNIVARREVIVRFHLKVNKSALIIERVKTVAQVMLAMLRVLKEKVNHLASITDCYVIGVDKARDGVDSVNSLR